MRSRVNILRCRLSTGGTRASFQATNVKHLLSKSTRFDMSLKANVYLDQSRHTFDFVWSSTDMTIRLSVMILLSSNHSRPRRLTRLHVQVWSWSIWQHKLSQLSRETRYLSLYENASYPEECIVALVQQCTIHPPVHTLHRCYERTYICVHQVSYMNDVDIAVVPAVRVSCTSTCRFGTFVVIYIVHQVYIQSKVVDDASHYDRIVISNHLRPMARYICICQRTVFGRREISDLCCHRTSILPSYRLNCLSNLWHVSISVLLSSPTNQTLRMIQCWLSDVHIYWFIKSRRPGSAVC